MRAILYACVPCLALEGGSQPEWLEINPKPVYTVTLYFIILLPLKISYLTSFPERLKDVLNKLKLLLLNKVNNILTTYFSGLLLIMKSVRFVFIVFGRNNIFLQFRNTLYNIKSYSEKNSLFS